MSVWLGFAGGVIIAVISALSAWLVVRRSKSGTTSTSEAETLWSQAQEMREELRQRVVDSETRTKACEEKLGLLDEENMKLRRGLIEAENKILRQRQEIIDQREHINELREDLKHALRAVSQQASQATSDVDTLKQEFSLIQGRVTS